jgi:PTS system nitrogen regulatory IIA component
MLSEALIAQAPVFPLSACTRPALIVPALQGRDPAAIINELSVALHREGCIPDMLAFYHSALNQELLSSSSLGCGVVVPHARLGGLKQIHLAVGRAPKPVSWGPKGAPKVDLVFLLAVPATDAASYLHVLASLARLGQQPDRLEELRQARDADEMLAILEQVSVRQ